MNTLRNLVAYSWIATIALIMLTFGFIAANESYSMADANNALLKYERQVFVHKNVRTETLPVGFGSVPVRDLYDTAGLTTASGISLKGNALAVYITPDVFPVLSVLAFAVMVISLVLFGIGRLVQILAPSNFSPNKEEGVEVEQS